MFTNAYDAWVFLRNHPVKGWFDTSFIDALDVMMVKVNPETRRIEDNPDLNTEVEVWLESGPGYSDDEGDPNVPDTMAHVPIHDVWLDCGGPTFEAALINLAEKVRENYGE